MGQTLGTKALRIAMRRGRWAVTRSLATRPANVALAGLPRIAMCIVNAFNTARLGQAAMLSPKAIRLLRAHFKGLTRAGHTAGGTPAIRIANAIHTFMEIEIADPSRTVR